MNSRGLKRTESTQRILSAAIECFGEAGYTKSSITVIAQRAGVSIGLISQRFDKESLLLYAYETVLQRAYKPFEGREIYGFLTAVIDQTRRLWMQDQPAFRFVRMITHACDIPVSLALRMRSEFESGRAFPCIREAQEKHILPEGDTYGIFKSFIVTVINQINNCAKYGLELPDNRTMLQTIRFVDPEQQKQERRRDSILQTVSRVFSFLMRIDLRDGTGAVLHPDVSLLETVHVDDVSDSIEQALREQIVEDDRGAMRAFCELATIPARLEGKNSISRAARAMDGTTQIHTLLPLSRDENQKLTEILVGVQIIP